MASPANCRICVLSGARLLPQPGAPNRTFAIVATALETGHFNVEADSEQEKVRHPCQVGYNWRPGRRRSRHGSAQCLRFGHERQHQRLLRPVVGHSLGWKMYSSEHVWELPNHRDVRLGARIHRPLALYHGWFNREPARLGRVHASRHGCDGPVHRMIWHVSEHFR